MVGFAGLATAICGRVETGTFRGKRRQLAADHCHESGVPRALLCMDCNRALGMFRDDPTLLRAAAAELERWKKFPRGTSPF